MRLEFFPFPLLIGMVIWVVFLAVLWHRKNNFFYLFLWSVFWVYLLFGVSLTLFPIPIADRAGDTASWQSTLYILSRVNLIPFDYHRYYTLNPTYIFFREILANILLTAPCGFGISFITHFKARHVFWLALGVGFGIEMAQLGLCLALGVYYRGVDISDALMNALGVLFGYGFFVLFSLLYGAVTNRFRLEHKGLFAYIYSITGRMQFTKNPKPPLMLK